MSKLKKNEAPVNSGIAAEGVDPKRPDLAVLLAEWQPRMGLADWEIKIRYVPWLGSKGQATSWIKNRQALIEIHEPASWPACEFPPPVELIVLHELGHVHLALLEIPYDSPKDLFEEQIVEAYAKALYATKYAPRA